MVKSLYLGNFKVRNKQGFIQIPILIAIIAGVLVLGGGGYWGIKQYQSNQAEQFEREKVAGEEAKTQENAKAAEIENLKREVGELKKSQENIKLPITPETKKILSTSEIVSSNKKFIVSVVCQAGNGNVFASGVIIGKSQGSVIVLTNYHVTESAKIPPAGVPPCVVGDTGSGEYYYGQPIYYPSVASQNLMRTIDFSFVEIKDPIPSEILSYDESTGKYISQPSVSKTTLLSRTAFPKICSQNSMKAGEEIVVLGYPIIGGDFDLFGTPNLRLITTEGIISNDANSFENYFVSSAKIEQGNSGGGAFLKSENCLAGMPTYVQVGEVESLGRLINIPKLKNDYLSKIFIGI